MYSFLRFPNFLDKALTLSYDDGMDFDAQLVDMMKDFGFKGTFNINSGLIGNGSRRTMSADDLKTLYLSSGMEVAVHGVKHLSLTNVDPAVATREIIEDRLFLEAHFGGIIKGMAYAYGHYNDAVVNILKSCGIAYSRTVVSTGKFDIPTDWLRLPATCHHNNPELLQLADKFLAPAKPNDKWARPRLFYLWGHSFEFADNNNWHVLRDFADRVAHRDDVWYATNGEIYDYVKAFDRLVFSADGKTLCNPTATDLYLNYYREKVMVPAGQTVTLK